MLVEGYARILILGEGGLLGGGEHREINLTLKQQKQHFEDKLRNANCSSTGGNRIFCKNLNPSTVLEKNRIM